MWNIFEGRRLAFDICSALFGIASWISINGIWVELPLLVKALPESWALASFLSIIVQIANLGPITYSLAKWRWPDLSKSVVIYILLSIGILSSILLAFFWDVTTFIGGKETSTVLFVLVFFLSLVDCTSSVLFLPFMATFKETYLNSYLIGEGLSGFIPATIALSQGVGGNPRCENVTKIDPNGTTMEESVLVYTEARFSVEVFFSTLMVLMMMSMIAFTLMNVYFKSERADEVSVPMVQKETETSHSVRQEKNEEDDDEETSIVPIVSTTYVITALANNNERTSETNLSKTSDRLLIAIVAGVCFLSNGFLPSIQTYSCLPYGNVIYHLCVTLNTMINPVMAFAAFFIPCRRLNKILALFLVGTIFSAFIIATALTSPDMLWGQTIGGFLTVISWVGCNGLFSYVKISIAGRCREISNDALFWCGVFTQIGSAFGALLAFVLVNELYLFQQYHVIC